MAGDWLKMRTQLFEERSTMLICDNTGLDEFAVVGRLQRIWSWAGEHTTDGDVRGVTVRTIDRIVRHEGFGKAMVAADWLEEIADGVRFPRWDKYNSRSAKERAMAAKRQAEKRWRDEQGSTVTDNVTESVTAASRESNACHDAGEEERREEERREEKITYRSESYRSEGRSTPSTHSTVEISSGGKARKKPKQDAFDLSHLTQQDWVGIVSMAESVAKRVPPKSALDRRAWLKYAVMAHVSFSESWLAGAAESAATAKELEGTRQALFVRSLQNAAKVANGLSIEDFNAIFGRIEIPIEIWKSNALRPKVRV